MSDAKLFHSDSWILISVLYASEGTPAASLTDIIAAADYINHTIITRGELETGFSRLVGAGFLTPSSGGFSVSEAVKSFWETTGYKQRPALKAWDAVTTFIGAPAWPPEPPPDTTEEHYVTSTDYAAVVEAYQRRMRQQIKSKRI